MHSHTCLCPCECSHLEPLCIQIFKSISIHTSYHVSFCIWTHVVRTHIYVCALASARKYTYIPSQILLYMNPCCASWHMFVPLRVLTPRTLLYTYIYSQVYIYQESYHGYVGISTRAVRSHTCLCPCGCSHLEPLCIQIFTSISIHISYHE